MGSVTGALLINLLHLPTDFDDATVENVVDEAINLLNLFGDGLELPNLSGTAGSKTVTLTSPQQGAVIMVARTLFSEYYENDDGTWNLGGVSLGSANLLGNTEIMKSLKEAARLLYKRENSMEVSRG